MEGAEPFEAVLGALRGCYAEAAPLETFIRRLQESGEAAAEVLRGDDSPCYRAFVGQCLVCIPRGARRIPRPVSFQQLSSQSEVITRVVQRLCEKRKKNVLAYGYSLLDENSSDFQIMPSSNIYSYLPNTATENIRISGLWETLLSRIGDDVMMYLLEHCAIFMLVPPSNCYQVCGQPVYELISHNVDSAPVFVRQRCSRYKRSSLLDYMQKRLMFHRQYLSKLHWWKNRQRLEAHVSSMGNKKSNVQSLGSSCQYSANAVSRASEQIKMITEHMEKQSNASFYSSTMASSLKRKLGREKLEIPAKRAKVEEQKTQSLVSRCQYSAKAVSKASKQIKMVTEHMVKPSSSSLYLSAMAPSLKTKLRREQLEIPAKRAKVEEKVREEKSCCVTPEVNRSNSKIHGTGYVDSHSVSLIKEKHVSQRSNSDMSGPSLVRTSCEGKKFVAGESSFLQGVQNNKPLKSGLETQAESHRKGVEMHMYKSQLDSVQIKPMEGISSKCSRQEGPLALLAKKLPNTLLRSAVYIDRKFLLYSRRSFQERFPKSFLLNRLKGCQAGGRQLIETIFLSQNLLEQKHSQNLPHKNWRKKRLPKRYWQMRHIFQKLLNNHGKCPYLVLLRKHCPVWISETNVKRTELHWQAALPGEAKVHEQAEQFGKEPTKCMTSSRCESGHGDMPDNLCAPIAKSLCGESWSERQIPGEVCDSALRELLKQHSSHWQVYVFVRECLERVIPAELWGSNHNKCRFLKNVKAFISMGKFAKLSLQELMWKMRVNDCVWLRLVKGDHFVPAYEHCFREELLAKFLYWLMDTYVIELLRSFFYITETMFQKNMLFYYRKFIWGKLQNIGIRNHFAKVHLRALSSEEIEAVHQKNYVPMASKLRFIPKANGLRPIVKVSGVVEARAFSRQSKARKMHHYNTRLKNLFSVLNYERTMNTSFIGSSVFGKDDIYKTWKKFVTKVLESDGEIPHFYYVKADVSRAYDTIPHNKLVEVISRILNPEKRTVYCIRRYAVIMITTTGKARRLYKRHVSTFKDFMPDMKQFVSQLHEDASLQNAIIVEQSLTFNETSSSLFTFFLQMIHNNILEIGNRYYLQCCGIPQGSILSTLLCSLCYGDMENKLLCGVQQDGKEAEVGISS
ncbi:telomerase reverse transcriptase isoform X2 [Cuculus canorus]|uniref:telomerase reverse transcriptase isoform X2 n=1 Tax=Cuculus canorus TaxID=55661 RepID=UPI0023AAC7B4|nr:telomerase reverse transcriptase isoform X2 [Cuculus canorus]